MCLKTTLKHSQDIIGPGHNAKNRMKIRYFAQVSISEYSKFHVNYYKFGSIL